MSRRGKFTVITLTLFICGFAFTAAACEPIYPFVVVVGGPGLILQSTYALLAAVVLKSVLFARFQKTLPFGRSVAFMVAGNVLSTIVGIIVAVMIGSGPLLWFGLVIVFGLCLLPAKRLTRAAPPWLPRWTPNKIAFALTAMLFLSCMSFVLAQATVGDGRRWEYWIIKLIAVYLALIVSICLTVFWEEWVIWKLSRSKEDEFAFVKPVVRANLVVMLILMGIAAAIMLPKRLKSPDHLIDPHAALESAQKPILKNPI